MHERPRPDAMLDKHEPTGSQYESLEGEEKFQLEVIKQLQLFFDRAEIVTHQPSGKEIAHIYFDNDDENALKEAVVLLDLLDIFPWEDELRNELLIDSSWDIEKLILLGLLQPRVAVGVPEPLSDGDVPDRPHRFGSFPTPRVDKQKNNKPQSSTSDMTVSESDAVMAVDEYIERDYLDEAECTEALIHSQGKYTSIDTAKGFHFLRTHSKYRWQYIDGNKCLLRKSDNAIITKEEQEEILLKAQNELGTSSQDKVVTNEALQMHMGLVYFVLNNLISAGFRVRSLEDTLQEGLLGLQRAIELRDVNQSTQFSTYAVIHIESRMRRFCVQDDLVRIPTHIQSLRAHARNEAQAIESKEAYTPTITQVAEKLQLSPYGLARKLNGTLWNQVLEPIENYIDTLVDELDTLQPDKYAEIQQCKKMINDVVETLPLRLQKVIRFRFGILPGDAYDYSHTLEQIATIPGLRQIDLADSADLSRERVRQMELKAFRTLRHPRVSEGLYSMTEDVGDHSNSIHPNNKDTTTAALHDRKEIEE